VAKLLNQYLQAEFEAALAEKDGGILVHYQGLSSKEAYQFRTKVRSQDAHMHVVKASTARVYCRQRGYSGNIDGVIHGPVAIITSKTDAGTIGVAKAILNLVKEQPKIKIQGAIYDGEVLGSAQVEGLSRMPSREQLLARLAGAFQAPTQRFASAVYQINARFASVLSALQSKREKEEG
jgi:large subunit ribosomal protein L10